MASDQTDEEILRHEVSDEAIEAASVALRGLPTLMHNTYCYACPSLIRSNCYSAPESMRAMLAKTEWVDHAGDE